ncbi:hypothetical protein HIM_04928 [Hirsutella minnesotensis 3608]|uniref:Uncharacterized protein n=1 Tax=Hirsutella minnesotensis 3608 TaxID=1043627 RepID=A0A0F7ZKY4_9HYPO|nr:hypothetical protein HIM_04928 [Hirsutella minnesotensis 3608]
MGPKASSDAPSAAASHKRNAPSQSVNQRSDANRQKRAKLYAARSVPAQPAHAALKDGELDLQAFVAAHEFEIKALEQSMVASKAAGTSRAFQKVPRGLRRRTASHNPKRVPRRLRARAKREIAEDNTPLVEPRRRKPRTTRARIRAETAKKLRVLAERKKKRQLKLAEVAQRDEKQLNTREKNQGVVGRRPRPKIRRNQLNEPPVPAARFRKRQINKTWLPTHMWHAKRARMTEPKEPLWRFAIPLTPNEKIYRPTHRTQGERGTMVWDSSYMSTIGLYGHSAGLKRVLKRIGLTQPSYWREKGRRWRLGTRAWSGMLSREKGESQRLIGPATVLWNPAQPEVADVENGKDIQRQVYLRVHPSIFLEVFTELLRLTRMENPRLYIEDLRFEIGSLELTGPASTEALLAILTPYAIKDEPKSNHAQLFKSLKGLTNPATLPANAVLSFPVQDPRLRYPPRKREFPGGLEAQMALLDNMAKWPAEDTLTPSLLFDRDARHRASCLPSQKSINRRRGCIAAGSFLTPAKTDPPIPIILMASRSASSLQTQGSWTLLAPWKCIPPFWHGLVRVPLVAGLNPRFGGMNEMRQVAFERGHPWFPGDYVATDAGVEWELEQRRKRKREWERRPKSKRIEWATLDLGTGRKGEVGDGHACDFERLFNLPKLTQQNGVQEAGQQQTNGDQDVMDTNMDDETQPAVEANCGTESLRQMSLMLKVDFETLVNSATATPIPQPNCVIQARLSLVGRGVVTSCARIYRLPRSPTPCAVSSNAEVPATIPPHDARTPRLPPDLRAQWLARLPVAASARQPTKGTKSAAAEYDDAEARTRRLAQELISAPIPYPPLPPNHLDVSGHPLVPDSEDLVGFVTTGCFCLTDGQAAAIGSIAVDKVLTDVRADGTEGRLCIVRNAGENVGWLARWEAV